MIHPIPHDYPGKWGPFDFNLNPPDYEKIISKPVIDCKSAYYLMYNTDKSITWRPGSGIVHFNCKMEPIPWMECGLDQKDFPSAIPALYWTWPHWAVGHLWMETDTPGLLIDGRTFEQIMEGCCPPFGFMI